MSNQVHLYEIYKYADDEGSRKHNVGFTQAFTPEEALKNCAARLNFNVGTDYYVNQIKLVDRNQLIEFPKEFELIQRPTTGTSFVFTITKPNTELQDLRRKAQTVGLNLKEIARFVELGG